ncbi:MAG: LysR family transcriptional regulator [Rhodanobacteraceae bacterium]|nr:LysR family transcriptional regulator [Rhodanobacteraceae bacterium]
MKMTLQDLRLFLQIAKSGSLSAAARLFDLSPAAASASLKRLEAELAAPLFVRSTRSLRLTPEGETFLQYCRQGMQWLDEGRDVVATGRGLVRGQFLLSVPSDLGRNVLPEWMNDFQTRFPDLRLRLQATDRLSDLFREPVDAALRYGAPSDSSMVALPLAATNVRILCAAPAYLERTGPIERPEDLPGHNCLCFVLGDDIHNRWRFHRDGSACVIDVRGDRISDDGDIVRRWALAGIGIACKSALDVADDLIAGRLVALCQSWQGEPTPLNLICADRRQLTTTIRELRQHLSVRCDARLAALSTYLQRTGVAAH